MQRRDKGDAALQLPTCGGRAAGSGSVGRREAYDPGRVPGHGRPLPRGRPAPLHTHAPRSDRPQRRTAGLPGSDVDVIVPQQLVPGGQPSGIQVPQERPQALGGHREVLPQQRDGQRTRQRIHTHGQSLRRMGLGGGISKVGRGPQVPAPRSALAPANPAQPCSTQPQADEAEGSPPFEARAWRSAVSAGGQMRQPSTAAPRPRWQAGGGRPRVAAARPVETHDAPMLQVLLSTWVLG